MSIVKKEARLSGLLLARKGTAQPAHTDHRLTVQAMDPMGITQNERSRFPEFEIENSDQSILVEAVKEINNVTRRQYNNTVKSSPEENQDQIIVSKEPASRKIDQKTATKSAPPPQAKKKVKNKRIAMTLRMEHEDHLKLRLYAAHSRQSCQEIISAALEMYLSKDEKVCGLSDCNCLKN